MRNASRVLGLAIMVVVLASAARAADLGGSSGDEAEKQVVKMKVQPHPQEERANDLGYGNCQWLYPRPKSQETLLAQPRYKSENPVFYAAHFGDSKDSTFTLVIDESGGTGSGYDALYIDRDNDNRIDEKKERIAFEMGTTSGSPPLQVEFCVTAGGKTATHYFMFSAFPYSDERNPVEKIHSNLRNSSYYTGEAVIAGKRRKIALADLDTNGIFNDPEQRLFQGDRFFVNFEEKADENSREKFTDSFPYGDYTEIEGQWYSIVATRDGSQVTITRVDPPLGTVKAPQQIVKATLRSPSQTLDLDFSKGKDQGIAGTYTIQSLTLRGKHPVETTPWDISATYPPGGRSAGEHRKRQDQSDCRGRALAR